MGERAHSGPPAARNQQHDPGDQGAVAGNGGDRHAFGLLRVDLDRAGINQLWLVKEKPPNARIATPTTMRMMPMMAGGFMVFVLELRLGTLIVPKSCFGPS